MSIGSNLKQICVSYSTHGHTRPHCRDWGLARGHFGALWCPVLVMSKLPRDDPITSGAPRSSASRRVCPETQRESGAIRQLGLRLLNRFVSLTEWQTVWKRFRENREMTNNITLIMWNTVCQYSSVWYWYRSIILLFWLNSESALRWLLVPM